MVLALRMAARTTVLAGTVALAGSAILIVEDGVSAFLVVVPVGALALLLVFASYYVAALLGGSAYFFLAPVSHRWLGQILLAAVLGFIVYGTVGLTFVLAYAYLGPSLLDYEPRAEAWRYLLLATGALTLVTALIGPPIWRFSSSWE